MKRARNYENFKKNKFFVNKNIAKKNIQPENQDMEYDPRYSSYLNSEALDWIENEEWPDGALECKEKKHTKIIGNQKITKVIKVYYMEDGEVEVVENTHKVLI